jgi:N-acetylgalactosamine-N,N'-diacetylbacillosaminyl-diphospho-undecaprenol 4-alpha-N-acetylgalactosaminyltransferase
VIQQSKKYKIAIIAYNLDSGGLAKVIKNVFLLFKEISFFNVELVLLDDIKRFNLDEKVVYFGDLANIKSPFYNKINKYIQFNKYIKKNNFDFIIDLRYRINPITELLIVKLIYPKTKLIYNVHSSKLETYLLNNTFLTNYLYGKAYKTVCGAKENEKLVIQKHHLKNTITIYNPIDFEDIKAKKEESIDFNFEYILAVGRFVELKQFYELIISYANSILPQNQVKLVLVGEGEEFLRCKELVFSLNLNENVVFVGFSNNPYKYMQNAKFLVLCSKYEGFGLVLVEALACNTPVISFDLVSGPNEIIEHGKNGLLVENQNFDKLTEAINLLFSDEELYTTCKINALESVQKFSFEEIKKEWLNLLQIHE